MKIPTLTTERLQLRSFRSEDAQRVQELAGNWDVAKTTANIPHPYEDGMAEEWISTHADAFKNKQHATFAIDLISESILIGAIGLNLHLNHEWAELGYWIGKPYWNQGYCTEAALEILRYGFDKLGLNRIQARHMLKNPASGCVMEKIGMSREGTLRQSLKRFGNIEDAMMYSILREEYESSS